MSLRRLRERSGRLRKGLSSHEVRKDTEGGKASKKKDGWRLVRRISSKSLAWRWDSESGSESAKSESSSNYGCVSPTEHKLMESAVFDLRWKDFVEDKQMLYVLLEFSRTQHCSENLLFWLVAHSFKILFDEQMTKQLGVTIQREVMVDQAKDIFNTYISCDSSDWVCLSPRTVQAIQAAVGEGGDVNLVSSTLFTRAQDECRQTIERDCIPRFIKAVFEQRTFPVDVNLRSKLLSHCNFYN